MNLRKDLVGERFGRWVVTSRVPNPHGRAVKYLCKCDCGNEKVVFASNLTRGLSTSCGCLHKEVCTKHGKYNSKELKALYRINDRCYNPKTPCYKYYGGRGIEVCYEWRVKDNPEALDNWISFCDSHGFADGLTVDRENNDEGYNPQNVRFVTMHVQSRNKRSNVYYKGVCLTEWCKTHGVCYQSVWYRMNKCGESLEQAVEHFVKGGC